MSTNINVIGQHRVNRQIFRLTRDENEVNLSATVGPGWGSDKNYLGVAAKADLPQRNQTATVPVYPIRGGVKGQPRHVLLADVDGSFFEVVEVL